MKIYAFLPAVMLLFAFAVSVSADSVNICDLDNVPVYPTMNSSMLLIVPTSEAEARMGSLSGSPNVRWEVYEGAPSYQLVENAWGSMKKFNGCWVCEFAGISATFEASSGPTPFRQSGNFLVKFYANDFNSEAQFNRSVDIYPERIVIEADVKGGGEVEMTAYPPPLTENVTVTIYNAETGEELDDYSKLKLDKIHAGLWFIDFEYLPAGVYYASVRYTKLGGGGGNLLKFEIAEEDVELTAKTDKTSYWIGEKVLVSGRSTHAKIYPSVAHPDGKKDTLSAQTVIGGIYSFEFPLLQGYSEGDYVMQIKGGDSAINRSFTAEELFTLTRESMSFTITDKSQRPSARFTIENKIEEDIEIDLSTQGISRYVTVSPSTITLAANASAAVNVTVDPSTLSSDLSGKIIVTGQGVAEIPIDVSVILDLPSEPQPPVIIMAPTLAVSPALWDENQCVIGGRLEKTFTLQNNGDDEITDFGYTESGLLLEADPELPASIDAEDYDSITLVIIPDTSVVSGSVEITSSGGSATVHVRLDCAKNISADMSGLRARLNSFKDELSEAGVSDSDIAQMLSTVEKKMQDATDDIGQGKHVSAYQNYMSAKAAVDAIEGLDVISPSGGDCSWATGVIIILALALAGVVAFLVYDKFGAKLLSRGGEGGGEEEGYNEELY